MKLYGLLATALFSLRAASMALAPIEADGGLPAANATEHGDENELARRAWTSPNEMMFYWLRWRQGTCSITSPACFAHEYNWMARRDSCDEDACSDGVLLQRDGFKWDQSLCDKPFWSCRVAGAHWNLVLRRTNDPGSCEKPTTVLWETWNTGRPYASMHDLGAGGRKVGDCWVERGHSYVKSCNPVPFTMQSVVRCAWRL